MYWSFFFFSSRRRHTRWPRDWSSDVCSSDLRGNTHMNLGRAAVAQQLHKRAGSVAAHDRVVDQHHALALQVGRQRVELQLDADFAQMVVGLNEGAADIAVLRQPFDE